MLSKSFVFVPFNSMALIATSLCKIAPSALRALVWFLYSATKLKAALGFNVYPNIFTNNAVKKIP
jgi:hypothetical protein